MKLNFYTLFIGLIFNEPDIKIKIGNQNQYLSYSAEDEEFEIKREILKKI